MARQTRDHSKHVLRRAGAEHNQETFVAVEHHQQAFKTVEHHREAFTTVKAADRGGCPLSEPLQHAKAASRKQPMSPVHVSRGQLKSASYSAPPLASQTEVAMSAQYSFRSASLTSPSGTPDYASSTRARLASSSFEEREPCGLANGERRSPADASGKPVAHPRCSQGGGPWYTLDGALMDGAHCKLGAAEGSHVLHPGPFGKSMPCGRREASPAAVGRPAVCQRGRADAVTGAGAASSSLPPRPGLQQGPKGQHRRPMGSPHGPQPSPAQPRLGEHYATNNGTLSAALGQPGRTASPPSLSSSPSSSSSSRGASHGGQFLGREGIMHGWGPSGQARRVASIRVENKKPQTGLGLPPPSVGAGNFQPGSQPWPFPEQEQGLWDGRNRTADGKPRSSLQGPGRQHQGGIPGLPGHGKHQEQLAGWKAPPVALHDTLHSLDLPKGCDGFVMGCDVFDTAGVRALEAFEANLEALLQEPSHASGQGMMSGCYEANIFLAGPRSRSGDSAVFSRNRGSAPSQGLECLASPQHASYQHVHSAEPSEAGCVGSTGEGGPRGKARGSRKPFLNNTPLEFCYMCSAASIEHDKEVGIGWRVQGARAVDGVRKSSSDGIPAAYRDVVHPAGMVVQYRDMMSVADGRWCTNGVPQGERGQRAHVPSSQCMPATCIPVQLVSSKGQVTTPKAQPGVSSGRSSGRPHPGNGQAWQRQDWVPDRHAFPMSRSEGGTACQGTARHGLTSPVCPRSTVSSPSIPLERGPPCEDSGGQGDSTLGISPSPQHPKPCRPATPMPSRALPLLQAEPRAALTGQRLAT